MAPQAELPREKQLRMRRWISVRHPGVSAVLLIVLRTCAQGWDDDMPPTVSVERTFSELEVGGKGINVVQLQEALVAAGHVVMVDGDFGPQTQAAVVAFQSLSRLTGDRDRRSSDGDALRHLARLGTPIAAPARAALAGCATPLAAQNNSARRQFGLRRRVPIRQPCVVMLSHAGGGRSEDIHPVVSGGSSPRCGRVSGPGR